MLVNTAINAVIAEKDSITTVERKPKYVLTEFLRVEDVFVFLPTGCGKNLIYQLAPLMIKMLPGTNPIIVLSPLVTLMEDQIREASNLRFTPCRSAPVH